MSIDSQHQGSRDIVSRVKAILMTPKTEWPIIAVESATIADLYKNYAIILAAIPAIALFISMSSIFGMGIGAGLTMAVVTYVLSLVGVFISALIIDALAPTFGSAKDQMQALKTAVYSITAYWVASAFQIIPGLGALVAIVGGLYGIYLLYLGLPFTMKTPADKAVPYTAVIVICTIVVMFVLNLVLFSVVGTAQFTRGGFASFGGFPGSTSSSDVTLDPNSPLGAFQQYASKLQEASKKLESAQNSGDADARAKAFGNALGTVLGGGGTPTGSLAPDQLRSIVPERLGGLARSEISVERNDALGMQISQAEATYSDGSGKSLDLEITDLGGMGFMALAAWANTEQDRQTSTGFERTYRANNRILHEVWDQSSMHGEFTVITSNRFLVKIEGDAPNMDALKAAAGGIDLAALDRLGAAQASAR